MYRNEQLQQTPNYLARRNRENDHNVKSSYRRTNALQDFQQQSMLSRHHNKQGKR